MDKKRPKCDNGAESKILNTTSRYRDNAINVLRGDF